MKLLLIDGYNLTFRVTWTNKHLSLNGMPVSLLFGFFQSLIYLKKLYQDYLFMVVWEGGHERRDIVSRTAKDKGIIPSVYKDRSLVKIPPALKSIRDQINLQMPTLKEALKLVNVGQVSVDRFEADDVIYSYVKRNNKETSDNIVVTSDKDYYQMLGEKVMIYDAMADRYITGVTFQAEYGISPDLWVDVGALQGDKSDNIHGVPGVGLSTALKMVKRFGTAERVIEGLETQDKRSAKEQAVLDHKERVIIAKSLKKMDIVPELKAPRCGARPLGPFMMWLNQYNFNFLKKNAWRLCSVIRG